MNFGLSRLPRVGRCRSHCHPTQWFPSNQRKRWSCFYGSSPPAARCFQNCGRTQGLARRVTPRPAKTNGGVCEKPRIKCTDCPHQKFPRLDAQAVEAHLRGTHTIDAYAIREDDSCIFLAADFDGEGWRDNAQTFAAPPPIAKWGIASRSTRVSSEPQPSDSSVYSPYLTPDGVARSEDQHFSLRHRTFEHRRALSGDEPTGSERLFFGALAIPRSRYGRALDGDPATGKSQHIR